MQVYAIQVPSIPVWSVNVPGFHCAVARIAGKAERGFFVDPTKAGLIKFPEQCRNLGMDGFRTLEAAVAFVQTAFDE